MSAVHKLHAVVCRGNLNHVCQRMHAHEGPFLATMRYLQCLDRVSHGLCSTKKLSRASFRHYYVQLSSMYITFFFSAGRRHIGFWLPANHSWGFPLTNPNAFAATSYRTFGKIICMFGRFHLINCIYGRLKKFKLFNTGHLGYVKFLRNLLPALPQVLSPKTPLHVVNEGLSSTLHCAESCFYITHILRYNHYIVKYVLMSRDRVFPCYIQLVRMLNPCICESNVKLQKYYIRCRSLSLYFSTFSTT